MILGLNNPDDSGVFRLDNQKALVQTTDFFTPIVDDAQDFGRIAAANALSDIFAMGASPITALNLVAFPYQKIPLTILSQILNGGQEKVEEAGATIIGGHTIEDIEPKYGLAVTGLVDLKELLTKKGAMVGDILIMTKQIGTGIVTTGIKRGVTTLEEQEICIENMKTLNQKAQKILNYQRVNALTDITGFGLLGHLMEMLKASGVGAKLSIKEQYFLPGTIRLAEKNIIPGGSKSNYQFLKDQLSFAAAIPQFYHYILADAVTSGGLLAAVKKEKAQEALQLLKKEKQISHAFIIGEIISEKNKIIIE